MLAIGAIENFDSPAVRQRILAGDREPQTRALDAAFDGGPALVERIEDALALLRVDAGTAIDDVEHGEPLLRAERNHDRRRARRILDRIRHEVVDDRAHLVGIADDLRGHELLVEGHHPRKRRELVLAQHALHHVLHRHGPHRLRLHRARLVVGEEILDQLLQRQRVLADDAHDLPLFRRQLAADVVAQELRAFAHRGERRLELVRDVPQEPVLLLFEIGQARAQPFEALPEVAQVLRSVHFDPVREVGGAHPADRLVELPNRARDQHGEKNRQRERDRRRGEREVQPLLPPLRRDFLQPLDRALGQLVRRGEHRLRAIGKPRVTVGELRLRVGRSLRHRQELVEPALAVGQRIERRQRFGAERQQRKLCGRRPEFLPDAIVVVEQCAVVENEMLAHDALERSRLLEELAARSPRLRRLLHRFATLRLELVERKDELAQRIEQRQAYQQEAEQDELEEGTGVIHERRRL